MTLIIMLPPSLVRWPETGGREKQCLLRPSVIDVTLSRNLHMHNEDLDNNYHNFGTGKEKSKDSYCIKKKKKKVRCICY